MADHPALGFDPAPGHPASVLALAKKLTTSATSLGEAGRVVGALVSHSASWQGEAATAFRASLSSELPRYLNAAHTSLTDAARQLNSWHETLVAHRALAARYESRAAAATTDEARADARRLAHELASDHTASARAIAKTLNSAAAKLTPKEPGMLASLWNKITEDPGDALSNASAILGAVGALVSLACPPAGLAIMLVGSGLSLAALATHVSDPKFRRSLTDGITKGQFDADFWKSSVTLLGDTLGSVPGLASVASGAKAGTAAARTAMAAPEASALSGLSPGAGAFARDAWSTGRSLQEVENPLSTWALRSTDPAVPKAVGVALPVAGGVTATSGYLSDSESVEQSTTAADGARVIMDDAPSNGAKAAQAWTALRTR